MGTVAPTITYNCSVASRGKGAPPTTILPELDRRDACPTEPE